MSASGVHKCHRLLRVPPIRLLRPHHQFSEGLTVSRWPRMNPARGWPCTNESSEGLTVSPEPAYAAKW